MTTLYQKQYQRQDATRFIEGEQDLWASSFEGFSAAHELTVMEGLSTSRNNAMMPFIDERARIVEELLGETIIPIIDQPWTKDARELFATGELSLDADRRLVASSPRAKRLLNNSNRTLLRQSVLVEEARRIAPDRVLTEEQILAKVSEKLKPRREELQEIMGRSPFWAVALGTMAGVLRDPVVLSTLPVGLEWQAGRIGVNFARAFASEFLLGSSTEAIVQAQVYRFKKEIESPYSSAEAILNVLAAGLGAGAIRATGGLAIDVAMELRKGLAAKGAARVLDEAGFSQEMAQRVLEEVESRIATAGSVEPRLHSDAVGRAVQSMSEGRLPEGLLGGAEAIEKAAIRAQANEFLDQQVASLLPEAGKRLSRGDRANLQREAAQLEFRLAQLQSDERFRELVQARIAKGETGRKAKLGAAKDQAAEVKRIEEDLNRVKARLAEDNKAREAERELSRLEQARRKDPVEAAVKRGFSQPTTVAAAVKQAAREALQAEVHNNEARMLEAQRVSQVRRKPKVDKGAVPPALRGEAAKDARKVPEAPSEAAPAAPSRASSQVSQEVPDVPVAVGERADGSPEIMSSKEAMRMLDSELDAIERVEACLLRGE